MDLSLTEILDRVDAIHGKINRKYEDSNYLNIRNDINEISNIAQCLRSILLKVDNIYHICDNTYNSKLNIYKKNTNGHRIKKNDWVYLNKSATPNTRLTNDIPIRVKTVNKLDEVPNTPMYWVKDINQFAISINGVMMRGNIGNIYDKTHIQKNKKTHQVVICTHGNKCRALLHGQICKFYHDPVDVSELLQAGEITAATFAQYKNITRNYINTSWIHTDMPSNKNNNNMRHFGSRNTLKYNFDLMKINNSKTRDIQIQNYKHQCMHDILVIMGLNQHELIGEYTEEKNKFIDRANSFSSLAVDT